VTAHALTLSSRVPGANAQTATVEFTLATSLTAAQKITVNWPAGFFAAGAPTGVSGSALFATAAPDVTVPNTWVVTGASTGPTATRYSLIFAGVTMGPNPLPASCASSFWVSSDNDIRSVSLENLVPALGGQVSAVSLTVSSRVPRAATQTATVAFTLATALTAAQRITVNWPAGFFAAGAPTGVSGSALFAAAAPDVSVPNTWVVTGAGDGPTATRYSLIFAGVTMGPNPLAANLVGITVRSDRDLVSVGVTSGVLGGRVSRVSVDIASTDRVPAATGKSVTIGFTTQSALLSGQTVTVIFPDNFLTGTTIGVTFAGAVNTFATTATAVGTDQLTIAVGSAGAIAAAYTITLTGVTMPVAQGSSTAAADCAVAFGVQTTTDMIGGTNTPQIGGVVSRVMFSIAPLDRVPASNGKTVTVSFSTQTALVSGNLVFINFPPSYISGSPIGVTFAGALNTFATTATAVGTDQLTIAVGSAGAVAATYTITLTGATMGSPIGANALTGISVRTTTDTQGNSGYPALGGQVTAVALNIATSDRIAALNRRIIVSFTLATALASGNTITVRLPLGLVQNVVAGDATGILARAALADASGIRRNIVLTASGVVTAAAQMVTICGVQLGLFPTNNINVNAVEVVTTMDYTATCSETGTVGTSPARVTAVSMNIPLFASRVAGNTAQTVTFAFTTSTLLPTSSSNCNSVNRVTITFPNNFFVANGVPVGSCTAAAMLQITGLDGYTLTGSRTGPSSTTQFIFTGTDALNPATYTVVIAGLTLGPLNLGDDLGIRVETSLDAISIGAPSGPISGYMVTSVTMPSSCQVSSSCQNVVIGFSSTAGSILKDGTLDITFTTAPVTGSVQAFMSGDALIAGALTTNTLRLTVQRGTWVIGSTVMITLTGMTVSTGLRDVLQYVSVGGSTNAYSMTYMPTGTGTTTTTSLTVARPFLGVTNTMFTVAFSTTNGIAQGDIVRVFYPTGFFIGTPQFATCGGGDQYPRSATGLGSCSSLSISNPVALTTALRYIDVTYNRGGGQAAGPQTMVVSGVTLSTTAVAPTNTFSVVTTQNSCSAGMVSTGAISTNPGPGAPGSSGASVLLSTAVAIVCSLLFWL